MNIAILLPSLSGGGAERVAQRIGDYYTERGERVFYFVGDFGLAQDYEVKGNVVNTKITELDISSKYGRLWTVVGLFRSAFSLYRLKKKYRINVSISFMEIFNYLNVLSRADDKVILRVCTILSERPELSGWMYRRKWIEKIYSRADKIVVMSTFGFHEMRDIYGIPEKNLAVIPNPISLSNTKQDEELRWEYGPCPVLFVGRLDPVKQPDRILRSFRYVAERVPEAELFMIGKGPLDTYLKSLCRKYGLEKRVVFTGFRKDIEMFQKKAKVFVMASKVEGFPNAMIEAMAFGVPIVATDSPGGIHDILGGGEYGIITPPLPREKVVPSSSLIKEEIALGEAILSILKDKELYRKLRDKSMRRVREYEIGKIMGLWDKIIK